MEVTIKHQPAYTLAIVTLKGNEDIRVEPGAMVSHTDGMVMETKAEGGFMGGFKRMLSGENFFVNTFLRQHLGRACQRWRDHPRPIAPR